MQPHMNTLSFILHVIISNIDAVFGNTSVHGTVFTLSFITKSYLLYTVFKHALTRTEQKYSVYSSALLLLMILGSGLDDLAWIIKLVRSFIFPQITYAVVTLMIRVAWLFMVIKYQALALLLEHLANPRKTNFYQKLFFITSTAFALAYVYFIIVHFDTRSGYEKSHLEYQVMQLTMYYCILLATPSLFIAIKKVRERTLPKILNHQLKTLLMYFVGPLYLIEVYNALQSDYISVIPTASYALTTFYTILITAGIYFCARKMVLIRFLNFYDHVHENKSFSLFDYFKETLAQLSTVTNCAQVQTLTQVFFKETFRIAPHHVTLHTQINNEVATPTGTGKKIEWLVEQHTAHRALSDYLQKHRILIFDELEFNHFYEQNELNNALVAFMHAINADIFIPLYEQHMIIGYIIVERNARKNELYNDVERDAMIIFTRFVAHTCVLIRNSNIDELIVTHKKLQDSLHHKQQEIEHYKESFHSFITDDRIKRFGIVYYKSRSFVCANQEAHDLLKINPSTTPGHPVTQTLKTVVRNVQLYKTAQTANTANDAGEKLVLTALPTIDSHTVLIIIHPPNIADLATAHRWVLKDPTQWDYMLYLETTNAGRLINKAIPGSSNTLVNAKIRLLGGALSKKALVLDAPDEDLIPLANLVNHIHLGESLHVIDAGTQEENITQKIFGTNPIFGIKSSPALMHSADGGAILISNCHLMDEQTQKHLEHYLKYGVYQPYKSTQQHRANVRILLATHHDLKQLRQGESLIETLYELLRENVVHIPSPLTLSEGEFLKLTDDVISQLAEVENVRPLTTSEKTKLLHKRPTSIFALKKIVTQLLTQNKTADAGKDTLQPPLINQTDTDPLLVRAAHLGKNALRDPQLMAQLWDRFKNQNKIATLLGVNRSSINKRCKEYKLTHNG